MIKSKVLSKYPNLGFAVTEIPDGNMSYTWGKTESEVTNNLQNFWEKQGVELRNSVGMLLAHSTGIQVVDDGDRGKGTLNKDDYYNVDALVTNTKGLVLYVLTADCCPIILFDPSHNALGVAHASWKNTDQEYMKQVVAKMESEYGTNPSELAVFIGPCIHAQSYAFNSNDEHIAQREKPNWQPYLKETNGKVHIDIVGYNIEQLKQAGVRPENIEDSGIDTYSAKNYFSHRQSVVENQPEGRLATLAWLK